MRYGLSVPRTDRRPRQRLDAEARRTAILRAAGAAFSTQPYDKVSVAQVAEAAGASEALVHRYFAGKSGLYLAVIRAGLTKLLDRQRDANLALGPSATQREHLESTLRLYLDAVSDWSVGWLTPLHAPGAEPAAATVLRRESREHYVRLLRELLNLPDDPHLDYALHGYLGFLDEACVRWALRNHPPQDRPALIAQAIAALSGALTAAGHPNLPR